jgi:protein-S-isoprenylcysteine O-methyltransferase Ste14
MNTLNIINLISAAMWLLVAIYWLASARRAKANVARQPYYGLPLRLAVAVLIIALVNTPQVRMWLRDARAALMVHDAIAVVGLALCALGLGLALAARIQLGRNWGMPMSQKQAPQLVTGGPYAHARHPIYGGLILGMLGSIFAQSPFWLLPLVLFSPYFILSALREERLLLSLFPGEYAEYRRHTRLLIPFVV